MRSELLLCTTLSLALTTTAWAAIDPAKCVVPPFIRIVGVSSSVNGFIDASGAYGVYIKDGNDNPVEDAVVRLRFIECTDMKLCSVQDAGSYNCSASDPWVEKLSSNSGLAGFVILGGGLNPGTDVACPGFPGPAANCVRVEASENSQPFVEIGRATAVHYDPNGAVLGGNGVNPLDMSIAKADIGLATLCGIYRGRSDLSMDGQLTAKDLSFLKTVVGASGLGLGSAGGCATITGPVAHCP